MSGYFSALEAAKAMYECKASADTFIRHVYDDSRAKYIVRVVVKKTGVRPALTDELFQEAILVLYKLLDKINNPEGFYSFWYLIVWRSAQTIKRLYPVREVLDSQRTQHSDQGEEDRISAEEADTSLIPLDEGSATAFARTKFSRELEGDLLHQEIVTMTTKTKKPSQVVGYVSKSVQQETLQVEAPEKKPRNNLSLDQAELAEIRVSLGFKIDAYAQALSIPRDRLTSYLYGRANVPPETLEYARELREATSNRDHYSEQIKTRVRGWRERLSLTEADDGKLSKALGITLTHLKAIESGDEPMTSQQIAAFEAMIERVEAFIA